MIRPNIIVDPCRPQENKTLIQEMQTQPGMINSRIWAAIADPNSVVRSISLSHKQIVEYAKQKGIEEVLILEEDVKFTSKYALPRFIDNKPPKYDLYLGGAYGLNQLCRERMKRGGPGTHEIHNFAGLHCYMIHSRYYDKFLSMPEDKHIDDQPGMGLFYVIYPFIAIQHPGWSSNNRGYVDYSDDVKDLI